VFPQGLKTNIAIHLAVLLTLAMILIDFVMIITAQRALLRSEISKGYAFISGIEANLTAFSESENVATHLDFQHDFNKMLSDAGFSCALVMDANTNPIYFDGKSCALQDELKTLTSQTIQSGKKTTRFFGSTWGVFWKQSKNLIVSAPLLRDGSVVAGTGIVLPLEGVYEILRRIQSILLVYIFANVVVFTLIGLYRLSRITIKPLQKLVNRAEEYREDDEMLFLYETGDNEFGKLTKALNNMLKHIAEDKAKLQTTVMSLEKANLDLKQAQKDIIRAEKLASVGRLSSGIAHEIGNPIGIISGYLELLKQNDISDDDKKDFLLRTENEINRVNTIIRQLLDISRPSREDLKAVCVHSIIEDTIDVFKFQPLMSNIELQLDMAADQDIVIADPNQLRQVFLNLVINSVDAISSAKDCLQGRISITSETAPINQAESTDHPNMLKINYIDNGPGITEENLGNIFDPFFTTKEPGKGTGLGLAVCFMIIEGIGGKIEATSAKGEGTAITICLPLAAEGINGKKLDMNDG
jgi:signal transduction histidine kinase